MGQSCKTCNSSQDLFIQNCMKFSKNKKVKNVKQSDYIFCRISQKSLQKYRAIKIDQNQYIIFEPSEFYYEGQISKTQQISSPSKNKQQTATKIILKANGKGVMYWPKIQQHSKLQNLSQFQKFQDQSIKYEGFFNNNMRHGKGLYQKGLNGLKFEGDWQYDAPKQGLLKDKKQSYQIKSLKFANKNESMVSSILNKWDYTVGRITLQFSNRDQYTGQFKYNAQTKSYVFDGKGKLRSPLKKQQYDGEWKNGKFEGKGKYYWRDGKYIYQGYFKNGLKDGDGKLFYDGSYYLQGKWKQGKKQGTFEYKRKQTSLILSTAQFREDNLIK